MIRFAIPGPGVHTIDIGYPLPTIIDPVTIDGWSQPGWNGVPLIEIDGTTAGSGLLIEGVGGPIGPAVQREVWRAVELGRKHRMHVPLRPGGGRSSRAPGLGASVR